MDVLIHYCPVMAPNTPAQMALRNLPHIPRKGEFFRINKVAYLVEKVNWECMFNPLGDKGPVAQVTVNVFLQFIEDQSQK